MIYRFLKRAAISAAALCVIAPPVIAETGVTSNTIIIGQSGPFSGLSEELGLDLRRGMQLYFDYINDEGGVNGRKIVLESLDDGFEPNKAVSNTKKLLEEKKVFALMGYVGTPSSMAVLPVVNEANIPFVAPFTGAEALRSPANRQVFNVRASNSQEIEKIVSQLTAVGMRRIAVFYQNDADGKAGLAATESILKRKNIQVVASGAVERNTTDVAAAVKAIARHDPQAVVMISAYKSCAEFIRQMWLAGSNPQFMNTSSVGSKALADELGDKARGIGISQVVPSPWNTGVPVVKEYQIRMREISSRDYTFTSLEGYIAAKVMVEGLKRAGKNLTREKFIEAMESIRDFDIGGFPVTYTSSDRYGSRFVDLTVIGKDGKFLH